MKPGLLSFLEKIAADLLPGGKADRKVPHDFPAGDLRQGQRVELEHTKNRALAKEIAMDHLTEDPRYYDKLRSIHKEAAPVAQPQHQEFLDEHFSISPAWKDFKKKLRSPSFVEAVKQDTRANEKLKRYSEANAKHVQARGVPYFKVPSQSSSKWYTVKYHPDVERFSCNCGDWVHARSHQQGKRQQDCKHVQLVKGELKTQGISNKDLTKQAAAARAAETLRRTLG